MVVIAFPKRRHGRASTGGGYRSGRSSWRGTPVKLSTARTRRGGTSSHCETACIDMPNGSASLANPPTCLIARCRAADLSFMIENSSTALDTSQASLHCAAQDLLYAIDMTLGKRIFLAREKAGLTQAQVGKVFKITGQAVSQWERGKERPDIDKLPKLWKTLKVPPEWLLDGEGPPPDLDPISAVLDRLEPRARSLALRQLLAIADHSDEAA